MLTAAVSMQRGSLARAQGDICSNWARSSFSGGIEGRAYAGIHAAEPSRQLGKHLVHHGSDRPQRTISPYPRIGKLDFRQANWIAST